MKFPQIFTVALLLLMESLSAQSAYEVNLRQRNSATDETELSFQQWDAKHTALIVCDVWDVHHSKNAAARTEELVPRVHALAESMRSAGSLIIHAPSDCMKFYEDHTARSTAKAAPTATNLPKEIDKWLYWKNEAEEKAGYPIDATDGGGDDDPAAQQAWLAELKQRGRNPDLPWIRQHEGIRIDEQKDVISDRGVEIWNVLEARGIRHIVLCGVHVNMCVLGRPFGLRQLSLHGKQVALVRDLTDAMYNPAKRPQVSHFRGTELVIEHIEKFICPTISSDQLLGGVPFHFKGDRRKHLVMVIGEDEYKTWESLTRFARVAIAKDFRITHATEFPGQRGFPELRYLEDADALLVSVRRRPLPPDQMKILRKYVESGKPVLGIRTASHAWSPKAKSPVPAGLEAWLDWDASVLGGNYQNHFGKDLLPKIQIVDGKQAHAILQGVKFHDFTSSGSLYRNHPLPEKSEVLLDGTLSDGSREPVAWTAATSAGGRVFYTSLGHPDDFKSDEFNVLLSNALHWATHDAGGEKERSAAAEKP